MKNKLTQRQKSFADLYIQTGDIKEAAEKAGYKKDAQWQGCETLLKPQVKEYIADRVKELNKRSVATGDEVLIYLTKILRGEKGKKDLPNCDKDKGTDGCEEIGIKDRMKAAELLGKSYKLFSDRREIEGSVSISFDGEDGIEE